MYSNQDQDFSDSEEFDGSHEKKNDDQEQPTEGNDPIIE